MAPRIGPPRDGWLRASVTIARRYARLGPWAGLAVWFDLTRDWIDGDDPAAAWKSLS